MQDCCSLENCSLRGALVGADGINRAQAASGASHVITGGENGQAGESGGVGGSALGAGLSISSGSSVPLSNVSFLDNVARGGDGGDGGNGGEGGAGIGAIFNAGILRLDNATFESHLGIGGLGGQPGYGGLGGPSGIGVDGPYDAVGLLGE